MKTSNDKTVFMKYSSYRKGQHFITVIQRLENEKFVIGRIYRIYNEHTLKYEYMATNADGNQIFNKTEKLFELEKKFIENGKNLATEEKSRLDKIINLAKKKETEKEKDRQIRDLRVQKATKEKTKETTKENFRDKRERKFILQKIENGKDAQNNSQIKDSKEKTELHTQKEQDQNQEIQPLESDDNAQTQENTYEDVYSAREAELDEIREQQDLDIEEEIER